MLELERDFQINESTYQWSVRLFSIVKRLLKVNIKLHPRHDDQVAEGQIFLFNHFARFETFIPQYLIYLEAGVFCRSVASHEFFIEGDAFTSYLINLGAVPNNHPKLLPFLAAEILRGRKVVIFPEGGMVKDRRVLDGEGQYSVYSRIARERRKHHAGAAVLASGLAAFKALILREHAAGHARVLEEWAERLAMPDVAALLDAARKPTIIVPANITFYPIRVSDNLLRKGVELVNKGLTRRLSEELLIEGNILLKDTDMDIRLGESVAVASRWRWWEEWLLSRVCGRLEMLDGFFQIGRSSERWDERFVARAMQRGVTRLRDDYMHRMYLGVSVNLSHLASCMILRLVDHGFIEIDADLFHRMLYLAVKKVQRGSSVHLHRSLRNPEAYGGVIDGTCLGLEQFVLTASNMGLVERSGGRYRLLPKLRMEHEFDQIRLENLVSVYANEVEPIPGVKEAVSDAANEAEGLDAASLVALRFDDEIVSYEWDKWYFSKPRYADINALETATESGAPFVFAEGATRSLAIVLVHGFLASPAELRGFGERLAALGYPVVGVRLKGHGTSPWDLRARCWQDWLDSVRRGYAIASAYADRICLIGFSTGGALSLRLAADRPAGLAGVCGAAVPVRFRNRNMIFVPLIHGANRLLRFYSWEGIPSFRPNHSEHPHINYRHMPIRALYELRLLVEEMQRCLPAVWCPVRLLQGDQDPVVEPASAGIILGKLGASSRKLFHLPSERHGILNEDIGGAQRLVIDFLDELERGVPAELPRLASSSSANAPT